jgi:hypothetical protein
MDRPLVNIMIIIPLFSFYLNIICLAQVQLYKSFPS